MFHPMYEGFARERQRALLREAENARRTAHVAAVRRARRRADRAATRLRRAVEYLNALA